MKAAKRKKGVDNNPLNYKESNIAWLANKWYGDNTTEQFPSLLQVLEGVLKNDREEITNMFPTKNKLMLQNIEKAIKQRQFALMVLIHLAGVEDLHVPLDQEVLQNQPDSKLVTTLLTLMQMESPLYYTLNHCTI